MQGTAEDPIEEALSPWLKSSVFAGGLEAPCQATMEKVAGGVGSLSWDDSSWESRLDVVNNGLGGDHVTPLPRSHMSKVLNAVQDGHDGSDTVRGGWLCRCVLACGWHRGWHRRHTHLTWCLRRQNDMQAFFVAVAKNSPWPASGAAPSHDGPSPAPAGNALLDWLSRVAPDPRSALVKKAFPDCERVFLAVLLKHGAQSVASEAAAAVAALGAGNPPAPPSAALQAVWSTVNDLRQNLRTQRLLGKQGLLGGDASLSTARGTDGSGEGNDGAAAGVGESKDAAAAASDGGQDHADGDGGVAGHPVASLFDVHVPKSFAEVRANVRARCRLMLCFVAPRGVMSRPGDAADAAARGRAGAAVSQLEGKWANLLPPPTLPPLLARWRSYTPATDDGWTAAGGRDVPPSVPRLMRMSSSGQATARPAGESVPAIILSNCLSYATAGHTAPPEVVLAALHRRALRAQQRAFGLKSMLVRFCAPAPVLCCCCCCVTRV